jgi:pSer/pThr/pTyr-binding forkhead associated (FHA) protein
MADDETNPPPPTLAALKCFDGIPNDSTILCPSNAPSAVLALPDNDVNNAIVIGKASQVIPNRNALVVGRQVSSCDIRITHKSLSRQHALLYYHSACLYVFDLKTKTGTSVNHKQITPETPRQLNNGDTIQFGKAKPLLTVRWNLGKDSIVKVIDGSHTGIENGGETEGTTTNNITRAPDAAGVEIGETNLDGSCNSSSTSINGNNDLNNVSSNGRNNVKEAGLDPSIAGLTGREKRRAEIAAMMASLEEAPTYTKYVASTTTSSTTEGQLQQQSQQHQTSNGVDTSSTTTGEQEPPTQKKKKRRALEKYRLPFTECTDMAIMENANISSAVMDPTGARFAIGSTDSALKLYDFAGINLLDPTPFRNLIVDDGYPIRSMAYSSDGSSILIGTRSAQPRIFSRDGQELVRFVRGDVYVRDPSKTIGHTAAVTSVGWHPLEKSIVFSTSRDGSLRSWNIDKGKLSFNMLNCSDVVVIKHLRTGRKTIPSCLAVSPSTLAMGTECGSLQIYKYPLVSKLRPQQSVQVSSPEAGSSSKDGDPIISLVYSIDATKIAVRTKKDLTIWNTASRISSSTPPWAKYENLPLHDDDVGSDSSSPTMAFSPDGKTICVATNTKVDSRTYRSSLEVFLLPKGSKPKSNDKHTTSIFSVPILDGEGNSTGPVLSLTWHYKLNQLLVTTQKGFQVFYSIEWSKKGILLTSGRRKRRKNVEESLQEIYASRAPPPGSTIRPEQIITPNSLPLFSDDKQRPKSKKQRTEEEHMETVAKHIPQQPSKGVYNTGVNMFTQMIMDDRSSSQKQIAGMDPREALAKYSEGKSYIGKAYEGNVERILTEKTMEQEQDEMDKK